MQVKNLKMRSFWINSMGPKSNSRCPYKKRRKVNSLDRRDREETMWGRSRAWSCAVTAMGPQETERQGCPGAWERVPPSWCLSFGHLPPQSCANTFLLLEATWFVLICCVHLGKRIQSFFPALIHWDPSVPGARVAFEKLKFDDHLYWKYYNLF